MLRVLASIFLGAALACSRSPNSWPELQKPDTNTRENNISYENSWFRLPYEDFERFAWARDLGCSGELALKPADAVEDPLRQNSIQSIDDSTYRNYTPYPVIANDSSSMAMRVVLQNRSFRIAHWYRKKAVMPTVIRDVHVKTSGEPIVILAGAFARSTRKGWVGASAGLQLLEPLQSQGVGLVFRGKPQPLHFNETPVATQTLYDKPNGNEVASLRGKLRFREVARRGQWRQIVVDHGYIRGQFWYVPQSSMFGIAGYGLCGGDSGGGFRHIKLPAGACLYSTDDILVGVSLRDQNCRRIGSDTGSCHFFFKTYALKLKRQNGNIEMCMSPQQAKRESARRWKHHVYQ